MTLIRISIPTVNFLGQIYLFFFFDHPINYNIMSVVIIINDYALL